MTEIALPAPLSSRRSLTWLLAFVVAAVAVGGYATYLHFTDAAAGAAITGDFYTVTPVDLIQHIIKDGELQAVNNTDIICQVEGQTIINTLVKEGTYVKKGDVLITLDSSAIKQKIDDTSLQLQQAEGDLATAADMKDIQESQNDAAKDASTVALDLAKLDYQQYVEGTYPQSVASDQTDLEMAKITLRDAEEDLANTKSLYAKGFVTGADIEKSQLGVTTAKNGVDKAQTALDVLTKYTHAEDLASRENAVAQAEKNLIRTQQMNLANIQQKTSDLNAKTQAAHLIKYRLDHYQAQFEACTIKAPADGMVIYASSIDRNSDNNPIQEGATVREHQALIRLPDTSQMMAVVRIQEGSVGQLAVGQRAQVQIVGEPVPLPASISRISVLVDNSQRWWNPDLKEYPVELTLDQTPPGLKPGLGAHADILVNRVPSALAVPLPAIYAAGPDSYVFVRTPDNNVHPTRVTLGITNETHAQVLQGLSQGDQVLVLQSGQGADLLSKAGITTAPATTQPSHRG